VERRKESVKRKSIEQRIPQIDSYPGLTKEDMQ